MKKDKKTEIDLTQEVWKYGNLVSLEFYNDKSIDGFNPETGEWTGTNDEFEALGNRISLMFNTVLKGAISKLARGSLEDTGGGILPSKTNFFIKKAICAQIEYDYNFLPSNFAPDGQSTFSTGNLNANISPGQTELNYKGKNANINDTLCENAKMYLENSGIWEILKNLDNDTLVSVDPSSYIKWVNEPNLNVNSALYRPADAPTETDIDNSLVDVEYNKYSQKPLWEAIGAYIYFRNAQNGILELQPNETITIPILDIIFESFKDNFSYDLENSTFTITGNTLDSINKFTFFIRPVSLENSFTIRLYKNDVEVISKTFNNLDKEISFTISDTFLTEGDATYYLTATNNTDELLELNSYQMGIIDGIADADILSRLIPLESKTRKLIEPTTVGGQTGITIETAQNNGASLSLYGTFGDSSKPPTVWLGAMSSSEDSNSTILSGYVSTNANDTKYINFWNKEVRGVLTPKNDTDAPNKKYVDMTLPAYSEISRPVGSTRPLPTNIPTGFQWVLVDTYPTQGPDIRIYSLLPVQLSIISTVAQFQAAFPGVNPNSFSIKYKDTNRYMNILNTNGDAIASTTPVKLKTINDNGPDLPSINPTYLRFKNPTDGIDIYFDLINKSAGTGDYVETGFYFNQRSIPDGTPYTAHYAIVKIVNTATNQTYYKMLVVRAAEPEVLYSPIDNKYVALPILTFCDKLDKLSDLYTKGSQIEILPFTTTQKK